MKPEIRLTFSKADRLLNSSDYSQVFADASIKISHPQFLILARLNETGNARLGLIAAKKNLRLAVQRNRFKRHVRESFRLKQHNLPSIDAIVLARRGIENLNDAELNKTLDNLWKRAVKKASQLTK